jgi:hypothetical protein
LRLGYWPLSFMIFFAFHSTWYPDIIAHVLVKLTRVCSGYYRSKFFFILKEV